MRQQTGYRKHRPFQDGDSVFEQAIEQAKIRYPVLAFPDCQKNLMQIVTFR
jgi:hypothetical protein